MEHHEAAADFWSILFQILCVLSAALGLGALFEKFKQSAILGYLLAGTLLGPYMLNVVEDQSGVPVVAELGVSLLLFAIGLEFSAKRLLQLGNIAALGGSLQVVATLFVAAGCCLLGGMALKPALAVGAVLALSSTACVLRLLIDRGELDAVHGRACLGILLLQDVAVVPLVLLVTMLGGTGSGADLALGLLKAIGLILVLVLSFLWISNHLLPRFFRTLGLMRNRELLILLAVVLALGSAYLAHAMNLSPALGAFVAGVMLAESPFATQVRSDIGALRTLFVTLFFVSVGMLGDPGWILAHWLTVLLTVAGLVAGKATIITLVVLLFRRPVRHAVATGITLAQVGEFGVVIAGIAKGGGLFTDFIFQLLVSSTLISLFVTPFLASGALHAGRWFERRVPGRKPPEGHQAETPGPGPAGDETGELGMKDHIVLIGFGPSGQRVGEEMSKLEIPMLVLDMRQTNTDLAQSMGLQAYIGDGTHSEVLLHLNLPQARALVITIPDHRGIIEIIEKARELAPGVPIIARARYNRFVHELLESGAVFAVDEERQTGRRMAAALRTVLESQVKISGLS